MTQQKSNKQRIINGFKLLSSSKRMSVVFSDTIEMIALSIQQSVFKEKEIWENRENRYLEIIKAYNKKEQKVFPQIFALIVEELEKNPEQDFLGSLFMELELYQSFSGQFFTPYNLSKLMAEVTLDKKGISQTVKEKRYVSISDPACGAGSTLIASVNICKDLFKRLDYQNHVYFVGQDIDKLVAQMCYI